jgi:hypothetical protein
MVALDIQAVILVMCNVDGPYAIEPSEDNIWRIKCGGTEWRI